MEVRAHDSFDEFRAIAEPLYRRDPVVNTIELTLLNAGKVPADSLLLSVWDADVPVAAALQTPPYPLACNGIPARISRKVAIDLVRIRPDLNGVRGRRDLAMVFADAWASITGRPGTVTTLEMIYRLGTLRPRRVSPVCPATPPASTALCSSIGWSSSSSRPSAIKGTTPQVSGSSTMPTAWATDSSSGKTTARRVSMAMLRAPAAGVSRIGPVFTPQSVRGRGYGSAVTAAAATLARRDGVDDVVLFADLANPTSNAIYQRIGFEAVADSVRVEFEAGA